jgi:hypothetical protein
LGWLWAARMVDRYSATLAWKETDCGCPRTYQNRQGKGLSLVIIIGSGDERERQSVALSCHQLQSVAISGHQRQSRTPISSESITPSGTELTLGESSTCQIWKDRQLHPSGTQNRGHQRPSEAIRGHQRHSQRQSACTHRGNQHALTSLSTAHQWRRVLELMRDAISHQRPSACTHLVIDRPPVAKGP